MQVESTPLRNMELGLRGQAESKITPFLGCLRPPAGALAFGAKVGTPVCPSLAPNRGLAPSAGLIGLAVGKQLLRKVAGFTVYVLVLLVKGSSALLNGCLEDLLGNLQELGQLGFGNAVGTPIEVEPCQPERFIGIDVADTTDEVLVQ